MNMNNFIAYGCFFTSFFYVYKYIILLCISIKKNALALNEMSKTAETEILSFPGSGRPLPTWAHCGHKNKLFFFTKIDTRKYGFGT